jgi:hypothetical protein
MMLIRYFSSISMRVALISHGPYLQVVEAPLAGSVAHSIAELAHERFENKFLI